MKKKISLTGATSFLGRDVIKLLKKKYILNLLTRSPKFDFSFMHQNKIFKGKLEDKVIVKKFLKKSDCIVNIAFDSKKLDNNIKIIDNLIKSSNKSKTLKRFIHISTAVVIGKSYDDKVDEKNHCLPINKYQKIKFDIEKKLINELSNKIELIILRPTEIADYRNHKSTIFFFKKRCEDNFLNFFFRSTFRDRILNFVSIENVTESVIFFIKKNNMNLRKKNIFFISEDKKSKNFAYFYRFFQNKKIISFMFNSILMKNVVKFIFFNVLKKPNPYQIYSNNRIKKLGFKFKYNSVEHLKKIK